MATKTKTAVNLFANAKVKAPAKSKAPDKKIIKVSELGGNIKEYNELKTTIDNATCKLKMVEGAIKQMGREKFMELYLEEKKRPESFKLQDATDAACMFIVIDKYLSVDENKAEILGDFDDLLDETTTYTVNAELVQEYGSILSELIMNCKSIKEEHKTMLIQGEVTYCVKKGTLDRLMQYTDPQQVFELITPICQLKK